jgi:hypothetical protein
MKKKKIIEERGLRALILITFVQDCCPLIISTSILKKEKRRRGMGKKREIR